MSKLKRIRRPLLGTVKPPFAPQHECEEIDVNSSDLDDQQHMHPRKITADRQSTTSTVMAALAPHQKSPREAKPAVEKSAVEDSPTQPGDGFVGEQLEAERIEAMKRHLQRRKLAKHPA